MSLKLVFHGGECCGMKHIFGFYGNKPNSPQPAIEKLVKANKHDFYGISVRSDLPFFSEHAPEETTLERLDRYLDFLRRNRPSGIVEVCLGDWNCIPQKTHWHEPLTERGFKLVNENFNSNSGNEFQVYHLNMNEGE